MRNPFTDILQFLQGYTVLGRWPLYLFILLLIASVVIAIYTALRDPMQRTGLNALIWVARLIIGGMWFQQTLWKLPPNFTDNPDGVSGGLRYWMEEMGKYAAFSGHSWLVNHLMLPHFKIFASQVWAAETFIAISLMLGLFTRLGGWLGMLMAINLWLGLYNAPGEWPWTYVFLALLMAFFAALRAGRMLGVDALLVPRIKSNRGLGQRLLALSI